MSVDIESKAAARHRSLERSAIRKAYRRLAIALGLGPLGTQRLKTLYFMWGYWPIVRMRGLSVIDKLGLVRRFLRVDWNVLHGHRPSEIACAAVLLAERPAGSGEILVEAGCWRGGSTAKFSLLCARLGFRLKVFDSFEGVEKLSAVALKSEWNFSGQYSASEQVLLSNLRRFGCMGVCEIHKGWFSETLARQPVADPIRLAYVDCDLAKGTLEALTGILPALVPDGYVLSQDFHITPVRRMLLDDATWQRLRVNKPRFIPQSVHMVRMDWHGPAT
jgi:O-methyltransferase